MLTRAPLLLKVSPDNPEQAADAATAAVENGAAAIIATNSSSDSSLSAQARDIGGLTGRALREKSVETLRTLAGRLYGRTTLVSVGGIESGADVFKRLTLGASLVQAYTGFVYGGPRFVSRLNRELIAELDREGFTSVNDAVGAGLSQA